MKADQERKAAIIRAEGESESARLISEATRAVRCACMRMCHPHGCVSMRW